MKSGYKRILSVIMLLVMVLTLLPANAQAAGKITTTPTGYISAEDVVYQTVQHDGKTIRVNWGARGEECVFLSTYAQSFYTSDYSFDKVSKQQGGSSQSDAPQSELYRTLQTLMKSNHKYINAYKWNNNALKYTDCVSNDYSKISCFYSGEMFNSAWDSGKTWNKEHTWPNSKGLGGSDEDDIMMIRPTLKSENYGRGNTAYGEGNSYFDPGVSNRGDCARIFLYIYTRWGNTNGNGQYTTWGSSGVIENLDVLLKWMAEDPVDTWEMGRNDAVQSITGTRNVFVDYPEYAWLLFGKDVPDNVTTPSHNTGVSGNPGDYPGDSTGGSTGGNSGSTGGSTGGTTIPNDSNYEKVTTLNTGDKVVIVAPAHNKALSMQKVATYYNAGVDVSGGFGSITNDEIFTVTKNGDGTYSFVSVSGKTLALAGEYNSLNDTGSNKSWELSNASNGLFYLRNTGRDVYLDWYTARYNWSTYKPSSLTEDYELAFYKQVESTSGGNTGNNTGSNTGSNSGSSNSGSTGGSSGSASGGSTGGNSYADVNFEQATALKTGDKVLIIVPSHNKALSMEKTGYYNVGVDVSEGFQGITDAEVFTVTRNADGTYSFVSASGKTLALADQYNSLNDAGSNNKWELISAGEDGLFYLRNTVRDVYLDWYAEKENWSTMNPLAENGSLTEAYQLAFYKDADSNPGGNDGNADATEPSQEPTQPETQAPTQTPTEPTTPSEPAPTTPDDGADEKKDGAWIWIVVAIVVALAVAGGVCCYIFVIRPKQGAAVPAEEESAAPAEEETPAPPEEAEPAKEEGNE